MFDNLPTAMPGPTGQRVDVREFMRILYRKIEQNRDWFLMLDDDQIVRKAKPGEPSSPVQPGSTCAMVLELVSSAGEMLGRISGDFDAIEKAVGVINQDVKGPIDQPKPKLNAMVKSLAPAWVGAGALSFTGYLDLLGSAHDAVATKLTALTTSLSELRSAILDAWKDMVAVVGDWLSAVVAAASSVFDAMKLWYVADKILDSAVKAMQAFIDFKKRKGEAGMKLTEMAGQPAGMDIVNSVGSIPQWDGGYFRLPMPTAENAPEDKEPADRTRDKWRVGPMGSSVSINVESIIGFGRQINSLGSHWKAAQAGIQNARTMLEGKFPPEAADYAKSFTWVGNVYYSTFQAGHGAFEVTARRLFQVATAYAQVDGKAAASVKKASPTYPAP